MIEHYFFTILYFVEERDEKELDQDEQGSDEDSALKDEPFDKTLDEFVPIETDDLSINEKENSAASIVEDVKDDIREDEKSKENDTLEEVKDNDQKDEKSKENEIREDSINDEEGEVKKEKVQIGTS